MDLVKHRRCPHWTLWVLALYLIGLNASAGELAIFDVRKSLPLDPSEPVFHDYYVNGGVETGVRRGMYVSVVRQLPVYDPIQNKAQGELSVEVARLQIIHVERNLSVARVVAEFGAEDRPLVDYPAVMVGDRLDLNTASMEGPKPQGKANGKGKAASLEPATAPPIVVEVPKAAPVEAPKPTQAEAKPVAPVAVEKLPEEKPAAPQAKPVEPPTAPAVTPVPPRASQPSSDMVQAALNYEGEDLYPAGFFAY